MSAGSTFFDTNVLVYMYGDDTRKRLRAIDLFEEHTLSGRMVISTQVVQEFYATGSRKLKMPRQVLLGIVSGLLGWPLVTIGPAEILSAIDLEERYRISFWDGLILAAAETGGAEVLYTEDLNDGQRYGTVVARNPFAELVAG